MKTLEELKKSYDEKLTALKKEKAEALKQAKARSNKTTAAEKVRLRKQNTRIKIIMGGYLLAEIKKKKDKDLLGKIATTLSDKDKALFQNLASTL